MKNKIKVENILCLFIILNPIFDIASYWFRIIFNTELSITTILRPLIPVAVGIYIFVKAPKKEKIIFAIIGFIYLTYAIIHLYIARGLFVKSSFGNIRTEAQYVINYTFLIINLILYCYVFSKKDKQEWNKLYNSVAIMLFIYTASIFIAILTNTSSYTYLETKTGYKGWIYQGNSLSAIMVMSLFLLFSNLKNTKWKKFYILTIALTLIYLIFFIGTRVALVGAFAVTIIYIALEVIFTRNKKIIIIASICTLLVAIVVGIFGSNTIKRRMQVDTAKTQIIDEATGEVGTMTGHNLTLKNQILNGTMEDGYMTEEQKQALIELYDFSKEHNFSGNDNRAQQFWYNVFLAKNQTNPAYKIFGNGHKTNEGELVLENELVAILINFGLVGFILFELPYWLILIYMIVFGTKNRKIIDSQYIMLVIALGVALALTWLSGYVLFAMSSMTILAIISSLLYGKVLEIKREGK